MINLELRYDGTAPAIQFAAEELNNSLKRLNSEDHKIEAIIELKANKSISEEQDSFIIDINFSDGGGSIIGSNPRSVIFGVYKFLEMLGFRWIRPGRDGEYIPDKVDWQKSYKLSSTAGYRHRGQCIEGALTLKNVLETID